MHYIIKITCSVKNNWPTDGYQLRRHACTQAHTVHARTLARAHAYSHAHAHAHAHAHPTLQVHPRVLHLDWSPWEYIIISSGHALFHQHQLALHQCTERVLELQTKLQTTCVVLLQ